MEHTELMREYEQITGKSCRTPTGRLTKAYKKWRNNRNKTSQSQILKDIPKIQTSSQNISQSYMIEFRQSITGHISHDSLDQMRSSYCDDPAIKKLIKKHTTMK